MKIAAWRSPLHPVRAGAAAGMLVFVAACQPASHERQIPAWQDRVVEARLTQATTWRRCHPLPLRKGHLIEEADCRTDISSRPVSRVIEDCDMVTRDHAEALQSLVSRPACTGEAVERLESLAKQRPTSALLSDLSAAYYTRAQRGGEPADLVRALDAAERATERLPKRPESRFNRALALEALGFSREATATWNEIRRSESGPWAVEAGEHWQRLENEAALDAAIRWPLHRQRLPDAIQAGDRRAVAELIAPFPSAALRYVEEDVLPAWAEAPTKEEAQTQLTMAEAIAAELLRGTGDHYLFDVVEAVRRSEKFPAKRNALRKGHLAFRGARRAGGAAKLYSDAAAALEMGDSPLRAGARLGLALAISFERDGTKRAIEMLAPLEQRARANNYLSLLGRLYANHGYFLLYESRYVDSLAQYDKALAVFEQMKDGEFLANMHVRKAGLFRILGNYDLMAREIFLANRYSSRIADLRFRHLFLGEAGAAALALGSPRIALHYQNDAIRIIQDDLSKLAGDPPAAIVAALRTNLGIAMRARAAIQLHLERYEDAHRDLQEATDLIDDPALKPDANVRRALKARVLEVRGQSLLESDPRGAAAAFDQALALTESNEYQTFRAVLLMQRADARRRAGDLGGAGSDLRDALQLLRQEERGLLRDRQIGSSEALWSSYFMRFQEIYERLIRQFVEQKNYRDAFAYAEKARAFEPLDLVLHHERGPQEFRAWTKDGETLPLDQIRAQLPPGTFLIEYCVLQEKSYVWIVSHDDFDFLTLPAGEQEIAAWTKNLHKYANRRRLEEFAGALQVPFAALMARPLAKIEGFARTRKVDPKLVVIPDKAMHGLPFAALRNAVTHRYLVEDHPIAVAPSATLYLYSLRRDHEIAVQSASATPTVLLIGAPEFNPKLELAQGLSPLPSALSEVETLRQLYAPNGEKHVRAEATVPLFLARAPEKTIVHFSGHVIANPKAPFRTIMLLAPSEDHSGALEAEELLARLTLDKTRLVVLAACSSSGGVSVGPEGVAPLVRPFLAAGAPAVVGTLWSVGDDPASEQLVVQFHRHYREGEDADRALQLAQLDLLHGDKQNFRLLSWSPFQVIGYASSPFPRKTR